MDSFSFSMSLSHRHTHTNAHTAVFPSPLLNVFILARPSLRGESGPYWDLTHLLPQSLFCPLAALFHSLTSKYDFFSTWTKKLNKNTNFLYLIKKLISLSLKCTQKKLLYSKQTLAFLTDFSYCSNAPWGRGPQVGIRVLGAQLTQIKKGFKKKSVNDKRVHMCACAFVC